jgi:hypothetical protein
MWSSYTMALVTTIPIGLADFITLAVFPTSGGLPY